MEVLIRGVRNVFRNLTRSLAVVLILTVVICFSLTMLISLKAVDDKVASVESSIGTTVTISPAGMRGFSGGGEPLTSEDIAKIKAVSNVGAVSTSLIDMVQTDSTTNLQSGIEAGTLGQRIGGISRGGGGRLDSVASAIPAGDFKLPISVTGTDSPSSTEVQGVSSLSLTSGAWFDGATSEKVAVVGTKIAEKNSLSVGGTFTLHGETFSVVGIQDTGNDFQNNGIIVPIAALQEVSDQDGSITSVYAKAKNISSLRQVQDDIDSALGDKADVSSQLEQADAALKPLRNVTTIARYSLYGALVAGSVIILLTMLMIVRERRKEVGVLKAIGASNRIIAAQFLSESAAMSLIGGVLGVIAGVALGNPVLGALLGDTADAATAGTVSSMPASGLRQGGGQAVFRLGGQAANAAFGDLKNIQATVGWDVLGYGLLIALGIAIIGTLIPTLLIARIRPADVIRGE